MVRREMMPDQSSVGNDPILREGHPWQRGLLVLFRGIRPVPREPFFTLRNN